MSGEVAGATTDCGTRAMTRSRSPAWTPTAGRESVFPRQRRRARRGEGGNEHEGRLPGAAGRARGSWRARAGGLCRRRKRPTSMQPPRAKTPRGWLLPLRCSTAPASLPPVTAGGAKHPPLWLTASALWLESWRERCCSRRSPCSRRVGAGGLRRGPKRSPIASWRSPRSKPRRPSRATPSGEPGRPRPLQLGQALLAAGKGRRRLTRRRARRAGLRRAVQCPLPGRAPVAARARPALGRRQVHATGNPTAPEVAGTQTQGPKVARLQGESARAASACGVPGWNGRPCGPAHLHVTPGRHLKPPRSGRSHHRRLLRFCARTCGTDLDPSRRSDSKRSRRATSQLTNATFC